MTTAVFHRSQQSSLNAPGSAVMGACLSSLLFYIIAFPKGGIKVGTVPVTIGYVLTAFLLLIALLRGERLSLPLDRLLAFISCLVLALWSTLVIGVNGVESAAFAVSYYVTVLYLPLFGLVFFSSLTMDEHSKRIEKAFLWAIRFVVVYGIFLFVFRQTTGRWIEIPYLTVNAADVGLLDDKFINRGGVFKLISTYNNGNILGVCLAVIAPLYLMLETRRVMVWSLYLAMFLTLSRTVWIGALLVMILTNVARGVRPVTILYIMLSLLASGGAIVGLLTLLGRGAAFIFDSQLGGRVQQLNALSNVHIIPEGAVKTLPEIVYLGVLDALGIPGLIFFVMHLLAAPLLLRLEGVRLLEATRAAACLQGMMIYAALAGADAAFALIPVMMLFWMIAGLGFWYARQQASVGGVRA